MIGLIHRTRSICRQIEHWCKTGKLVDPIRFVVCELTGLMTRLLLDGITAERKKRKQFSRTFLRVVELADLFEELVYRPSIENNMMTGKQQHRLIRSDPEDRGTRERSFCK